MWLADTTRSVAREQFETWSADTLDTSRGPAGRLNIFFRSTDKPLLAAHTKLWGMLHIGIADVMMKK